MSRTKVAAVVVTGCPVGQSTNATNIEKAILARSPLDASSQETS